MSSPSPRPECETYRPPLRGCESRSAGRGASPGESARERPAAGPHAARNRSGSQDRFRQGARERLRGDDGIDRFRRIGGILSELSRRVRVHADGEPDRVPGSSRPSALRDFRLVVCGENHKRVCQLRVPRALDDRGEILERTRARRYGSGSRSCQIPKAIPSSDPHNSKSQRPLGFGIGIWTWGSTHPCSRRNRFVERHQDRLTAVRRWPRAPCRSTRCPSASPV